MMTVGIAPSDVPKIAISQGWMLLAGTAAAFLGADAR